MKSIINSIEDIELVNRLGEVELCDLSKTIALIKVEKEVQIPMKNLLKGAN